MANSLDAMSRLAEGQPAVDDVEQYVTACHRLGYQHPDLTAHATQVRDWYASEDGLDLGALDADSRVLSTVAAAAEDAARTQADLVAELSGAWSGRGAAAAREFTWRSGQAASSVAVAIRAAADAAGTLRDALWQAVDAKVATTAAIDGRQRAQRAEWLAAATTVTSGAGDLAAASELIDQQVKPFVANDIGSDWLAAMRTARTSINGAYDAALGAMSTPPRGVFEVPGELGPRAVAQPLPDAVRSAEPPSAVVQTVPAAAISSVPTPAAPSLVASPPVQPAAPSAFSPAAVPPLTDPVAQAPAAMPPASSMPSVGDLGAGTSSIGTGLSGFGQQLADLIGSLVGSPGGGLSDGGLADGADVGRPDDPNGPQDLTSAAESTDPAAADDENAGPAAAADETPEPAPDEDPPAEETAQAGKQAVECGGAAADGPVSGSTAVPTVVEPQPDPPIAPQAIPEAAAETAAPTPCEIAADELPQVGE